MRFFVQTLLGIALLITGFEVGTRYQVLQDLPGHTVEGPPGGGRQVDPGVHGERLAPMVQTPEQEEGQHEAPHGQDGVRRAARRRAQVRPLGPPRPKEPANEESDHEWYTHDATKRPLQQLRRRRTTRALRRRQPLLRRVQPNTPLQ